MNQQPHLSAPHLATQDPLAQLQDIQLPETIGLWPPAWGWWLLTLFIIVTACSVVFLWRRHRSRNAYRALALIELENINQTYNPEKKSDYLQAISVLLRRTAISGFGALFNSSIKGEDWLLWLDAQNIKGSASFCDSAGRALLIGPYQKTPEFDQAALSTLTKQWIQKHRNQWQQKPSSKTVISEAQPHV
jgi:cbb3-type cytochrome oxidase subunit 3